MVFQQMRSARQTQRPLQQAKSHAAFIVTLSATEILSNAPWRSTYRDGTTKDHWLLSQALERLRWLRHTYEMDLTQLGCHCYS